MCGRFTLIRRDRRSLAAELGVSEDSFADYRPRYNIAPLQKHFIVTLEREDRKVIPARWGLVNSWAKDASRASHCINAKAETVDKLPTFRVAFKKRRCLVPADGFYEWRGPRRMPGGRDQHPAPSLLSLTEGERGSEGSRKFPIGKREPLWIHPREGGLILFAGLYESWQAEKDQWKTTSTIITTTPNKLIEPIHNRMPVILSDRDIDDWMNPTEVDPLYSAKTFRSCCPQKYFAFG